MARRHKWKCDKCGKLAAHTGALCDHCVKQEHHERWMLLPAPTQEEIDDASAWLSAMQDEHDPVEPGHFVEDVNGEDQGEDYCLEHAREVAAMLGDGAYVGSTIHGETDGERWCARDGCGKKLDAGTFTIHGEASVLGLTEDDPMRAATNLYGLRRVGWNMTPNNPRAALWMWHVDDHRSDMADNLATAYRPEVP